MTQKEILDSMAVDGYGVVTCGDCGKVILTDTYNRETQQHEEVVDMKCPHCGFVGEICDFPDLF